MSEAERYKIIRDLALQDLGRRGLQVEPVSHEVPGDDDRLVDDSGYQYSLHNLQLECAKLPEPEWPGAVEFHFRKLLAVRDALPVGELPYADFLAQVRTRLQRPDTSGRFSMNYARPAFDGLAVEFSRDLPTAVLTVADSDVAGRDMDFLYEVGQRNTDAEPMNIQRLDHEVYALTGESFFIASKSLNMRRLIDQVLDGHAPLGVLFSVPYRSALLLHALGAAPAEAALGWFASVTLSQTENPPGGIVSADTYFWYGDAVQRITCIDRENATIEILSEGDFSEAYAAALRDTGE